MNKAFVERLLNFNKSYGERLKKFKPSMNFFSKLTEADRAKYPKEIQILSEHIHEYMELLSTELETFNTEESQNLKKLEERVAVNPQTS